MAYTPTNWENLPSTNTPINETNLNKIETGIKNIDDEIFYKSGDTYSAGYISLSGHITTGTTGVAITLFLPKRLDNITSITINTLKMEARGIKGYLNSNAGSYDFLNDSNYTVNVTKRALNAVSIFIKKSSAFTNVDNNTPVNFTGDISLTFN